MTVPTISLLTDAADHVSDTTVYNTASISPAANSMIVGFFCSAIAAGAPPTITPTGLSLSWSSLFDIGAAGTRRVAAWNAICGASPGSGAVTITHDVASTGTQWALCQVIDYNTSTPIPSGNVVSASASSGTAASVALPNSPTNSESRTLAGFHHRVNEAQTAGASFTSICVETGGAPVMSYMTERSTSAFQATANGSWTTSGNWMIIAMEIAGSTGAPPVVVPMYVPIIRRNHLGLSVGRA